MLPAQIVDDPLVVGISQAAVAQVVGQPPIQFAHLGVPVGHRTSPLAAPELGGLGEQRLALLRNGAAPPVLGDQHLTERALEKRDALLLLDGNEFRGIVARGMVGAEHSRAVGAGS